MIADAFPFLTILLVIHVLNVHAVIVILICRLFYEIMSFFIFSVVFTLQFVTSRGKSLVERVVKEQVCSVNTNEFTKALHI